MRPHAKRRTVSPFAKRRGGRDGSPDFKAARKPDISRFEPWRRRSIVNHSVDGGRVGRPVFIGLFEEADGPPNGAASGALRCFFRRGKRLCLSPRNKYFPDNRPPPVSMQNGAASGPLFLLSMDPRADPPVIGKILIAPSLRPRPEAGKQAGPASLQ